MSVAESGPYKSRFFNFISGGAQKFTDQSSRTWRYFKFATEIALQTALYPIYFILQTVRVTTQKLSPAIKQHLPQLNSGVKSQPPNVDTPIIHILNTVTTETESLLENSITSQPAAGEIQGVASQIDSQTLVLVQKDNQILDSLTVEQQYQLQQRISLEVANYHYYYRNLAQHPQPFQPQLQPFSHPIHVVSPIRGFWQVLCWVQTSPIAVKINCFGESDFVNSVAFPQPSPTFIHNLDFAIAQVEDYSIIPISQATHSLVKQSQTLGKTVIQTWKHPHLSVKSESSLQPGFDQYFYQVQSLILAAIDYFFQDHQQTINSEHIPEEYSGVISASKPASPENPWSTVDTRTNNILSKFKKTQTQNNPIENNRIFQKIQSSLNRFPTTTPENIGLISVTPCQTLTKTPNCVIESKKTAAATNSPDWLEAQVTSTGYIKHPLEKILGWLDQVMVKVEEAIAKTWYWLTHYE
ncbi:MAG TPA: hypothetical protein DEF27_01290 [Oscillatoriales bacterium UBA8482]|nr:MAG: hypothetical protein AUK43_19215 [Oscillatoriales cyanobacterium CG2_30_40_61]HBW56489.1 hypothetical protein [Oscillatoriales bacterium UBA8482]